jgi:hypothetical protein
LRRGAAELDLRPFQIGDLAGAQAVAIADKDERRVTMGMAGAAGGADELFDLGRRQIFACAQGACGFYPSVSITNLEDMPMAT